MQCTPCETSVRGHVHDGSNPPCRCGGAGCEDRHGCAARRGGPYTFVYMTDLQVRRVSVGGRKVRGGGGCLTANLAASLITRPFHISPPTCQPEAEGLCIGMDNLSSQRHPPPPPSFLLPPRPRPTCQPEAEGVCIGMVRLVPCNCMAMPQPGVESGHHGDLVCVCVVGGGSTKVDCKQCEHTVGRGEQ